MTKIVFVVLGAAIGAYSMHRYGWRGALLVLAAELLGVASMFVEASP